MSLFADDIILCIENPVKRIHQNTVELINEFSKVVEYKIYIHTNSELSKREIKKIILGD